MRFKRRNTLSISSIESHAPTQRLCLKGGFETTSRQCLGKGGRHLKPIAVYGHLCYSLLLLDKLYLFQ
jgi:hypothetical protein